MIHISKATKDALTGAYEVVEGEGGSRDQYLADNRIETFLIGRAKPELHHSKLPPGGDRRID